MKVRYTPENSNGGTITDEFGHTYRARITGCGEALAIYTHDTDELITTVPIEDVEQMKPHEGAPVSLSAPGPTTLSTISAALNALDSRSLAVD